MRTAWVVLAIAVLAAPAVAQGQGQGPDRRAELERQVRRQFMAQVGRRLELTDSQREAVVEILQDGADARRELAERSMGLRRDLMQAVRNEDTPMATYETLLQRLEEVREAERAIEGREEARLSELLDARQRAIFLFMRMQFNDRIRGMRGRPAGRGPGGGPMGGGPMGAGPGGGGPGGGGPA